MGNMGSTGNFGGAANAGPPFATANMNGSTEQAPHRRVTASQVTGVLRQAQTFQTQGRFNDAIDLCEQILESGFDRSDARYFLGWLYQEQQRWNDAIQQFQMLLNDPDYALSCYYALGQCYRALGDLHTATIHFDEAVDRVNLDALTVEESDQLVQLCQEAAEAHRALGEQEQALTVYSALLGFLRSRGWNEKIAQVEFMLQQMQNAPAPARPVTPPPQQQPMMNATQGVSPEQVAWQQQQKQQGQQPSATRQSAVHDAATTTFNSSSMSSTAPNIPPPASAQLPTSPQVSMPSATNSTGELPDWLTGILSDADKTQVVQKSAAAPPPVQAEQQSFVADQPTTEQRVPPAHDTSASEATSAMNPVAPVTPPSAPASATWLTEDARPGNVTRIIPPEPQSPVVPASAPTTQEQTFIAPEPVAQASPAAEVKQSSSIRATARDAIAKHGVFRAG